MKIEAENNPQINKRLNYSLVVVSFLIYYFSNPKPQYYYDYTFRVAGNLLRGSIGFAEQPPQWLNEFVPVENLWYSVFPLGSVLTMIPFAVFEFIGFYKGMPAAFISALTAGAICAFLLLIAARYEIEQRKRVLMVSGILLGTWMWTNLTMAGAWQLALGLAMIGELGAIYFTIFSRRPILAGAFFALAFGNRTEILLTAPVFMFLVFYGSKLKVQIPKSVEENVESQKLSLSDQNLRPAMRDLAAFCVIPFFLGAETLIYNYVRFDSYTDFGYSRIPGVLDEPWYNHGIFSVRYIPGQAFEMLFKLWEQKAVFPYLVPNGFSSSILFSSPFLLFVLRFGAHDKARKYAAWTAIFILTFLLWIHGNSGGWQFGYRYAMILLPWIFLILLENSSKKITLPEWFFYALSIFVNVYATYLFHWTKYVKP